MPKTKKSSIKNTESIGSKIQSIEVKAQNVLVKTEDNNFWPHSTISYSAISSFESCPLCFYLRYYGGIKWPETYPMRLGSAFQEALNLKYSKSKDKQNLDILEPEDISAFKGLLDKAHDFKDILSVDSRYIADFGLGIPIQFIPDLLTKHEIVENKYTGGYYNEKMAREQKQGDIYWYGIRQLMGLELPVKYQIFNKKKKSVALVVLDKNIKDVTKTLSWMQIKIWQIKDCYGKNNWNTGKHGKWDCNLLKACPIKYPQLVSE